MNLNRLDSQYRQQGVRTVTHTRCEDKGGTFQNALTTQTARRDTVTLSAPAPKPVNASAPADPNAILPTDSNQVKLEKLRKIAENADYSGMSYEEIYCAIWDRYQQAFDGKMPAFLSDLIAGVERDSVVEQFVKEIDSTVRYPLYREIQAETGLRYGEPEFSEYWDEHYRGKMVATALGYGGMAPEEMEQAILKKYAGKNTLYDFAGMMGELYNTGVLDHKMGGHANAAEYICMMGLELRYKCFPISCDIPTDADWEKVLYAPFNARDFAHGMKESLKNYRFENWNFDIQSVLEKGIDDLLSVLDKSVENAHAAVERTVQADLERSGYVQFEDRMIPLNVM